MSSAIVVPGYNPSNRVPGFFFALDNSKANTAGASRRVLLMGQAIYKTPPKDLPKALLSVSVSDAVAQYGNGSQIVRMLKAYRQIDTSGEVWTLGVPDDSAASAATGSVKIMGHALQAGTFALYIGDILIPVGVSLNDTPDIIAKTLQKAVSQTPDAPVSASVANAVEDGTATVMFTALNKGAIGNQIALGANLLGAAGGQFLPSGINLEFEQMSGGAQNPQLDLVLSAQNNRSYDLIAHPFYDEASLTSFKQWLNNLSGRWSPTAQLYGQGITTFSGTLGQALALPLKNDQHMSVMPVSDSPSDPVKWSAWLAAQTAMSMRDNPALPVKSLQIPALPPSDVGTFDFNERNILLHSGLSTFTVSDDGTPVIERIVTTYTENNLGNPDNSYLDIELPLTAQVCLEDLRLYLASLFSRTILLPNGSKIPVGVSATTPEIIKSYVIARYRYQCDQAWADDPESFARGIKVEYAGKGNVKMLLPYKFADQLWTIAGNCQFLPNAA